MAYKTPTLIVVRDIRIGPRCSACMSMIVVLVGGLLLATFALKPGLPLAGRLLGCLLAFSLIVVALLEDVEEPPFIP
jgi:hypothetical protein